LKLAVSVALVLRSFRVANHKSIRDEQELVLLPAYDKMRPVTPVAAIYGANASGKSNLLDALRWMRYAVRSSYAEWEPGAGVPRHPFRLDKESRSRPSTFSVDLSLDDVRFTYGFSVSDAQVTEEWLYTYPRQRKRVIFERTGKKWTFGSTVAGRLDVIRGLTRDNALFLSVAARSDVAETVPVYRWISSALTQYRRQNYIRRAVIERLSASGPSREELLELVRTADVGIADVRVNPNATNVEWTVRSLNEALRDSDTDMPRPRKAVVAGQTLTASATQALGVSTFADDVLIFFHGNGDAQLGLRDQSDGTRSWLDLASVALDVLDTGGLLLADELDMSLHPRLVARLIELFADRRTNPGHAQLVFTTHDAVLLGTSLGVPVLRRDEVWFVEKDQQGATTLFPLSDFHPRKEENAERRYLGGSYGAVPGLYSNSLVERLAAVREESQRAAS
jgi:hypothetical protein